jgi:pimeloyl-ACP methyl ester carboxylesterase
MDQDIRFCSAPDGVRIAYASVGQGPPLVKTANWLNHLEYDWRSPIWAPLFLELSKSRRLLRYDERGNGLSDWSTDDLSFEKMVLDLESVVDAAGLDHFDLFGVSQGCAVSIAYAVRHPDRVQKLLLYGGYARGWARRGNPREIELRRAMLTLIEQGWAQESAAFRRLWSSIYIPDATTEQVASFDELQRRTTSPKNAVALTRTFSEIDVTDLLPGVTAPTLVLHMREDAAVAFEEGRRMSAGIPGSRFAMLNGRNHIPIPQDPAWPDFLREVRSFLGVVSPDGVPAATAGASGPPGPAAAGSGYEPRRTVAHFELIERLGEGGMGEVWRAVDTKLGRDVALKFLRDSRGADPLARQRLLSEARLLASLEHPNIAPVHGLEEDRGRPFLVIGLVEGRSLDAILGRSGPLSRDRAIPVLCQVLDGLGAAHEKGILHRDLKPANVMVNAEGNVKLVDFGLATSQSGATLTPEGFLVGTPSYMSPEQIRGDRLTAASDIFSFGALAYEVLTGTRAFQRESVASTLHAVLQDPAPAFDAALPDWARTLEPVVRRCLEKDPIRRYGTVGETARALVSGTSGRPV